jgi:hypothetical protein
MADSPRMEIADLDEEGLTKVQALEQAIGGCVVALERRITFRDLSSEQLKQLQSTEEELGIVLMAYECE